MFQINWFYSARLLLNHFEKGENMDNKQYAYRYDKDGVYLRPQPRQENPENKGTYLMPAHCTDVEPPECEAPFVARWNGKEWEKIEDHRKHLNEKGQYDGGTPYWMPAEGDNYQSEPRYMTELGPLPEGAITERPAQTEAEKRKEELDKSIAESRFLLNSTDYRILKFMDAYISSHPDMKAKFEATYPTTLSERAEARAVINASETSLQNLN